MRINVIFYRAIVLLIILVAMTAGSVNAGQRHNEWIIIDSFSFGISTEQTARISVLNCMLADGSTRATANIIALVQLLDTEGAIIAQSSEISIEPGKIRFWDVPRESLPLTGDPGERIQVRPRIRVTTLSMDVERPQIMPSIELIDSGSGRTVAIFNSFGTLPIIVGESP